MDSQPKKTGHHTLKHKPQMGAIGDIVIEYSLDDTVVIFSHGFGVQRDSRGMFYDLAKNLPMGNGFVLFEHNSIDGDKVTLSDFTEMTRRLKAVIDWVYSQGVQKVHIVGHSMGAIVTCLAEPIGVDRIILLAPPLSIGENTRKYFMEREGVIAGDRAILVPRRDGTTSIISFTLFDEFEQTDASASINRLAGIHPLTVVEATEDEVLPDTDYSVLEGVEGITLRHLKADHNFTGPARKLLLKEVNWLLTK